jgi:O-antigen ligase
MTTTVYDSWGYYTERTTVLGQNPNNLANNLALGLIALLGIIFIQNKGMLWLRYLLAPLVIVIGTAIIRTGSRGGVMALGAGLAVLMLGGKTIWLRIRNVLAVLLAVGFLLWAINNSTMRARFEDASEGRMTGRENIYPTAWDMFTEKPITGWGPADNTYELGSRIPHRPQDKTRDFHNLPLSIMTSTGILGSFPLFTCLALCVIAGWKARHGPQGILPLAMAVTVLGVNTGGDWSASKLDWLVMAYAVASSAPLALKVLRRAVARPGNQLPRPAPRPRKLREARLNVNHINVD